MKRYLAVGISAIAVLALMGTIFVARHLGLQALTASELASKQLVPPAPPDDNCNQLQRALAGYPKSKPARSANPFGTDDMAIYLSVLERWNSGSRGPSNVSNRTYPIEREISDCGCLKGIELQSIANAAKSFRVLTNGLLGGKNIRLVDAGRQAMIVQDNDPGKSMREGVSVPAAVSRAFSTGLFSMSEIAFDKDHRRGLVSYRFVCGSLCGSGGIWLFEKVDGVWKRSDRTCGAWAS